jgi:hypothetical protein
MDKSDFEVTVPCSLCHEGVFFSPKGEFEDCIVCGGTGVVTPLNICSCGKSCTTITDDIATCGDPICLAAAKRRRIIHSSQNNGHGWYGV